MWESMKDTYEAIRSQAGTMALRLSFVNLRPREAASSINDDLVPLLDIRDANEETNYPITDRTVMAHLLNTLPSIFGMLQTIINDKPHKDLTMQYINRTMLRE